MSRPAWIYVLSVVLMGSVLSGLALSSLAHPISQWPDFAILTVLCIGSHFLKARGGGHEAWHPNLVLLFAGVLLLPPFLFALLVIIPHLAEWLKERLTKSPSLRNWYIQPFNIGAHVISGSAARWVYATLDPDMTMFLTRSSVLAVIVSVLAYVLLNHSLVGQALVLARRTSWSESRVLQIENLVTDLVLLSLGYMVAVLWRLNPWLVLPALSPLLLIYRTLHIPRLQKQAQTDEKTGLWNARHFVKLFIGEIERASRYSRPLALIMADLDLLRNINNTYGHLAGDQVLAGIGQIIRATTRHYDIAARFGGEEFTIILPEAGPGEGLAFAERLRQAVESAEFEVSTSATPIRVTMSLGVACFPENATAPTDLMHEADVAVYQAKLRGRNCVVCASEVPQSLKLDRQPLEDRLRAPHVPEFTPGTVGLRLG